jgi:hypothetical protein
MCSLNPAQLMETVGMLSVSFSLLLFLYGRRGCIELPDRRRFCNVYLLHHQGRHLPCRPFFYELFQKLILIPTLFFKPADH